MSSRGASSPTPGRDLSGYNALSFWARAPSITEGSLFVGFQGDSITGTSFELTANFQQFVIPIPDPSQLADIENLFYFQIFNGNDFNSTSNFWFDDIQYVKLDPAEISAPRPSIDSRYFIGGGG